LKLGKEEAQHFAIEGLVSLGDETLLDKFLSFADQLNPAVKMRFIEMLTESPFAKESRVLAHLNQWAKEASDQDLPAAFHFYLAGQELLDPKLAMAYLKSPSLKTRGAAIICLRKSWNDLSADEEGLNDSTLAEMSLDELLNSDNEEKVCMGLAVMAIAAHP